MVANTILSLRLTYKSFFVSMKDVICDFSSYCWILGLLKHFLISLNPLGENSAEIEV